MRRGLLFGLLAAWAAVFIYNAWPFVSGLFQLGLIELSGIWS